MSKTYKRFMRKIEAWQKVIDNNLSDILNREVVPKIIDLVMEDYSFLLNGVADPKSKLAPELYEGEFRSRLEDFRFVEVTIDGVSITNPSMKNFDFSHELDVIENILEGVVGIYVEVSREDYIEATKMQTYRGEYKEVYLIKYTPTVKRWEINLDKKFDRYPFSNTPPIDIFGRANVFVEKNLDGWINNAIDKSEKHLGK